MDHTHARHTRWNKLTRRLAAVGLSALLGCVAGAMPTFAQPTLVALKSEQDALQTFSEGVLTADPAREIEIDSRRFALHPDAMVMDNEGKVRPVEDLRQGALVKFHAQERMIDELIWMLPE